VLGDLNIDDDEDRGGLISQRTIITPVRGPTLYNIFKERKRITKRRYPSVKAVYFLYKFTCN
jgi:hypothetical protein